MSSSDLEPETPEPQSHPTCSVSSDDVFKVGGTTIGSIAIGGAVGGTLFGPPGTVIGAFVCGIAGMALSSYDARSRKPDK